MPTSRLLSRLDYIERIDRLLRPVCGDGTEATQATLDGAITATDTALTLTAPSVGSWDDYLPPFGKLLIGSEWVYYNLPSDNGVQLFVRGAENTAPASHSDGTTVYLPASIAALGKLIIKGLVGDGSTDFGLGVTYDKPIIDLLSQDKQNAALLIADQVILQLTEGFFSDLETHIIQAGAGLTGTPSWAVSGQTFLSLNEWLRYVNDPITGDRENLVPPRAARVFWLKEGNYLDPKVVFPKARTLITGSVTGAGTISISPSSAPYGTIQRYNDESDPDSYSQGFAGATIRARCTAPTGSGTSLQLRLSCQGIDSANLYFGRIASVTFWCNGIADSDTFTIITPTGNVVFTAKTVPSGAYEYAVGGTDAETAANLVAAINDSTDSNLITATDAGSGNVTLTAVGDGAAVEFFLDASAHIIWRGAGGTTNPSLKWFGGGATSTTTQTTFGNDPNAPVKDDVEHWVAPVRDFTAALDMTTVGNTAEFSNGISLDRVLEIMAVVATGGDATSGNFVIETVSPRYLL
jgi:hypothetical protein